jgi:polyisoprenoid-binding protein YceI
MPTWTIDPTHAQVEFAVKHMAISTVRGQFKSFTATGETNDAGMPTALTMEIDAVGDLTIKGVTKSVTLTGEMASPIKDPWGNQRTSLSAAGKISRGDFGLTWNMALEAGGFLVSDEVKLSIDAQAVAS